MSEILLQTHALTKQYGHQKAVDNVDIHIKKGEIGRASCRERV